MMLGVLLARAGVNVLVLEKHQDFLRDFRGDTIHPSTLQVMDELGWLDDLLRLPHQKVEKLSRTVRRYAADDRRLVAFAGEVEIHRADAAMGFPRLPSR